MTNLRTAFAALVVVLLVLGWGGAAMAAMHGGGADWVERVDGAKAGPIRTLALVALLGSIVLAFVPDREAVE